MAFFLYVAAAAVFGKDPLINPFLGIFYVLLWVGLVPASLLLGPVCKAISPVRTISMLFAKLSGSDPEGEGLYAYPARLGYWPAALGLFAFVWLELVYPHSTDLGPVRLWCAAYLGIMLIGGALWGTTFLARADPFEVYSSLVAKLSIWGRRDGVLVLRSPLANLDTVPRARAGGGGRRAVRQHGVRLVPGLDALAQVRAVAATSRRACPTPWRSSPSPPASALILTVGTMATGVSSDTRAPDAARPVRALGGADHRRLHRGPLPDLLRRVRPADADPAQRPVQPRQRLPRHRATCRSTTGSRCHPTFLAVMQGRRRRARPRARRGRRPRPGDQAAAEAAPAHRSAAAAGGDGRLHRRAGSTCCSPPEPADAGTADAGRGQHRVGQRRRAPARARSRRPRRAVRPATSARSTAGPVVGQEVQPGDPGEALDHAGDVLLRPAERAAASG